MKKVAAFKKGREVLFQECLLFEQQTTNMLVGGHAADGGEKLPLAAGYVL
jgi:hypothetical protein